MRRNYIPYYFLQDTFKIAKFDRCKLKMQHIFTIFTNFVTSQKKKKKPQKLDLRYTVEHNYNEHAYNKFTLAVKSVSSTYLKIV